MKIILFASALALSTAAIAQDTTAPAAPAATPDATQPATPPATPDASAPAAAPAPDASAPAAAPDASAMPAAPAAGGDTGNASGAQQQAQSTDDSNLPACSKSVTDKCVQKGGSGHHAAHKGAMHHKKK
jgi:hypothetical protein